LHFVFISCDDGPRGPGKRAIIGVYETKTLGIGIHYRVGDKSTEGAIAHVLVRKYADHLPLYRQSRIYNRSGCALHRPEPDHTLPTKHYALR